MISVALAGVDLAATAVALVALVVLHVRRTGLSPVDDPVSQYGITDERRLYRVLTLALGAAGCAAAVLVAVSYPPPGRAVIVALLGVFALCRLAISWWPMDQPGAPRSTHGSVHLILAVGAFGAATVAAERLRHLSVSVAAPGATHHAWIGLAFWLMAAGLVGMLVTRRLGTRHRFFGAAERLIYVGIFVLLIALGVAAG